MAEAVYVGAQSGSQRDLERYIDAQRGGAITLPPEAMAGVLRSASSGMATISRADFLRQQGG